MSISLTKLVEDGEFSGPVARFLTDENKEALKKEFDLEGGELVVFVADKWKVIRI